jgi:hypothetical protein
VDKPAANVCLNDTGPVVTILFAHIARCPEIFVGETMTFIIILIAILVVNAVFGYWRANTRKFSLSWFLAIHIPVPIAIGLRLSFLGWSWPLLPAFVAAFFTGQYSGSVIRGFFSRKKARLSSFLLRDLVLMLSLSKKISK